jgi:hypothetical protein
VKQREWIHEVSDVEAPAARLTRERHDR